MKKVLISLSLLLSLQLPAAASVQEFRKSLEDMRFQTIRAMVLFSTVTDKLTTADIQYIDGHVSDAHGIKMMDSGKDFVDGINKVIADLGGKDHLTEQEAASILKEVGQTVNGPQ